LIEHAYEHVPYYRRLLDVRGIRPADIRDAEALRSLPILSRETVSNNLESLTARNIPSSELSHILTSGTTGKPLRFYAKASVFNAAELAFIVSLWNRVGYKFRDKIVRLGQLGIPPHQTFAYDDDTLRISTLNLTGENVHYYAKLIRQFKPKFIQASLSSIFLLAKLMREHNVSPLNPIKAILLCGEAIPDFKRGILEEMFDCRTFSWYGHNERTVLAGECELSHYLHVFPEYGVMELVGPDGEPITGDGQSGEIVGTGFLNRAVPFIRYRTGDIATYTTKKCSCGRNYALLERVVGRTSEYIVAMDGHLMPAGTVLFMLSDPGVAEHTLKIQFLQEDPGEVIVLAVPASGYTALEVEDYLSKFLKATFANSFKATVNVVPEIKSDESGKFKYVVQKLPPPSLS
jgi:phenylacetate-CoA ligase